MHASKIDNYLFIGGNQSYYPYDAEPMVQPRHLRYVNCCWTAEMAPDPLNHATPRNIPFGDSELTTDNLRRAKLAFAEALHQRAKGNVVVVRCQMGLNRSALITTGILIAEGMEPAEAIDRVREARGPNALFNGYFVDYLLDGGFPLEHGEVVWYDGSITEAHGVAIVEDPEPVGDGRFEELLLPQGGSIRTLRTSSVLRGRKLFLAREGQQ